MPFHFQQLAHLCLMTTLCIATQENPERDVNNFCHTQRRTNLNDPIAKPSMIVLNNSLRSNLQDSHDSFRQHKLSFHYAIDKNGKLYETIGEQPQEVEENNETYNINPTLIEKRAWHTGVGYWNGSQQEINNINTHAIGVLFVNEGTNNNANPNPVLGDQDNTTIWYLHTSEQYATFARLASQLQELYNIANKDIVGYGQVRINGKTDAVDFAFNPGPVFWQGAMEREIVLRPTLTTEEKNQPCNPNHIQALQESLHDLGYYIKTTGENDQKTQAAIKQLRVRFDAQADNPDDKNNPYDSCRSYNIAQNIIAQITAQKTINQQNEQ